MEIRIDTNQIPGDDPDPAPIDGDVPVLPKCTMDTLKWFDENPITIQVDKDSDRRIRTR